MDLTEKTVDSEIRYQGVIVTVRMDQAELPNGRIARREVVEHPGGVAILPLDEKHQVLTVRQYRYPFGQVLLEIPAGKMEPGEDPRQCALRELHEEVGAVPQELVDLGALYLSPGFCNEVLHLYLAQGLSVGESSPDEDEFLELERIPLEELVRQVMSGQIKDAKTVAAVLKTKILLER